MNKVLVYGGLGLTGLGVIEVILLLFGALSHQLDIIPKQKILEITVLWWVGTAIMFHMGSKFLDKGLNEKPFRQEEKQ